MSLVHFLHSRHTPIPLKTISNPNPLLTSLPLIGSITFTSINIQFHFTANYEGSKTSPMMEAGGNKESKASVDDAEPSEQVDGDARARRFYECIFCRRGFPTAQALGGHMNIHRKDRAKMRPAVIPSATEEPGEGSERCGSHCLIPSHQSSYPLFSESLRNYAMYFPASASSNREVKVSSDGDDHSRRPQELSLFGEELHLDLRSRGGDEAMEDREERKMDGKEEELDLELRLGHEPEARS